MLFDDVPGDANDTGLASAGDVNTLQTGDADLRF